MKVLVTGSSGLVGSEAVLYYAARASEIVGIDNDARASYFGPQGSTQATRRLLTETVSNYRHVDLDIRDVAGIHGVLESFRPDFIFHCAAQPSHDWSAQDPLLDFDVNARATLGVLEGMRRFVPAAVLVHMSTNKVYGDRPNGLELIESELRYDFAAPFVDGVTESMPTDQCIHSVFGASKLAADALVQEYGRNFGLFTACFRAGCITGRRHEGVPLHGFLSYLARSARAGTVYEVIGHKGKQVRDQIHASDVVRAAECFRARPRRGEVYNIGGGRENSTSVIEALRRLERELGAAVPTTYKPSPRKGDHICYYSDLSKFKSHFPEWSVTKNLDAIFEDLL